MSHSRRPSLQPLRSATRTSTEISRRHLLAGTAATLGLAGLGAAAGCSGGPGDTSTPSPNITWWDHFLPLAALEKKTFAAFTAKGGPEVAYTTYNPNDQGKALQLAFQSKQMPDVFTLAGVNTSPNALREAGWFAPLADAATITAGLPKGSVIEGVTSFEGKLYSFPTSSFRQYDTLPWANADLLDQAGLEPSTATQSWDQFRDRVRTAAQKTGKAGLLLPLAFTARMATFVDQLAQTAGFPGANGVEHATGEYHYDHEAYVQAIEFLRSFQTDKLLLPASSTLDARAGRARWTAGEAVFFFDGPYNVGVCRSDFPTFLDKLSVGQIPTRDGADPVITNPPVGGTFWNSATSTHLDDISDLLALFVTDDYRKGQAEAMDAAPIDLDIVADSDAHPTYKQACAWYAAHAYLGPSAVARKPEVSAVIAATKAVQPDLGTIVQGVMSGDVDDLPGTLKTLSDSLTKARDAAITAKGGGTVTAADWAFPDWQRGVDYVAG